MNNRLILGSASERRRKILEELGLEFDVVVPAAAEALWADLPRATAIENALRKSNWCRRMNGHRPIITADTVIGFDGRCVTKPATMEEAFSFFRMFSGKSQTVLTAVAFCTPEREPEVTVSESTVTFKVLNRDQIDAYFAEVDPLDKAGAYDVNQHHELIIESFTGSRTNIMGLPVETVREWLIGEGLL